MPTRADELAGGAARWPLVGVDMWEPPAQRPHAVWTCAGGAQHCKQAAYTLLLVARQVHADTRELGAGVRTVEAQWTVLGHLPPHWQPWSRTPHMQLVN